MANTFRATKEPEIKEVKPQKQKGTSLFAKIDKILRLDKYFDDGLPVEQLPKVIFTVVMILLYIANTHYAEKTVRKIEKLKADVEDLRADYTTLKASYMFESKQSEVAKKVAKLGLEESKYPPYKLELTEEMLENMP
ncbi:MAG TPA: FtsL-like putative cell division protein [Cytophagales bacterium]|nr:FtsL-like putative cell division protein [Cytophagales bacterium]